MCSLSIAQIKVLNRGNAVKRFHFHAEECTVACKKFLKTFLKSVLSKNATRLGKEKIVAGVPGRNFKLAC